MAKRKKGQPAGDEFLPGCLLLIGILFAGAAFLSLGASVSDIYIWSHRNGYRATEIVVEPRRADSRMRWLRITITATGERVSVPTKPFETPVKTGPRTIQYNPAAKSPLFDERVQTTHDPQSAADGFATLGIGLVFAVIAWLLIRQPRRRARNRAR